MDGVEWWPICITKLEIRPSWYRGYFHQCCSIQQNSWACQRRTSNLMVALLVLVTGCGVTVPGMNNDKAAKSSLSRFWHQRLSQFVSLNVSGTFLKEGGIGGRN
jgi:hypothetical protein